jgi:hypothetical protein
MPLCQLSRWSEDIFTAGVKLCLVSSLGLGKNFKTMDNQIAASDRKLFL